MATLATATEKKTMSADEKHERKPQRARVDDKFKIFCGTANQPLADEVCAFLGMDRGQAHVTRVSGWRGLRADPGERARRRCFHDAADLPSGGRAHDGVAADDRRAQSALRRGASRR